MRGIQWLIVALAAVGIGLLLVSHWVHALGLLPYVILLACPLLHLFHRHPEEHRQLAARPGRKEAAP